MSENRCSISCTWNEGEAADEAIYLKNLSRKLKTFFQILQVSRVWLKQDEFSSSNFPFQLSFF